MALQQNYDDYNGQVDPAQSYYGGIPYTSVHAPNVPTPGFQQPGANVPSWQVATGNGAAPPGSFLPDWMAGQPSQTGATDQSGTPYPAATNPATATTATATSTGGAGGAGGGAPGGGLFNPALYTPFQGQAPSYTPPTLPGAPNFDDYYNASAYQNPVYHAPTQRQAPAYVPGTFTAPTLDEAQKQPGYQFGVDQGERALQQSRAAQGLLRTGGTLKDILDYGRNAATQNYGNVFNQDLGTFQTNEGGRVNAYNTNYQTQVRDPNQYDLQNAQSAFTNQLQGNQFGLNVAEARFAPQMAQYQTNAANAQRQAELGYNADWQKYLDSENVFYANQSNPFNKYTTLAQIGSQNA